MNYNSFKRNLNKNGLQEINPIDAVYEPDKHLVIENYDDQAKVSKFKTLLNYVTNVINN